MFQFVKHPFLYDLKQMNKDGLPETLNTSTPKGAGAVSFIVR